MQKPLCSIIIPCFNTEEYVVEAIESALAQQESSVEVILVDDGSTDKSADKIKAYLQHSNFKYIYQENQGLSAARNTGIRHSNGDYLRFLDADDILLHNATSHQVEILEKMKGYGLCFGSSFSVDEKRNLLSKHSVPTGKYPGHKLLINNKWPVHAGVIRKQWIDKVGFFDEKLKACEDWDMHLRLYLTGCIFYSTSKPVCEYRQIKGSMSRNVRNQTKLKLQVISKVYNKYKVPNKFKVMQNTAELEAYLFGASRSCLAGDLIFAKECIKIVQKKDRDSKITNEILLSKLSSLLIFDTNIANYTNNLSKILSDKEMVRYKVPKRRIRFYLEKSVFFQNLGLRSKTNSAKHFFRMLLYTPDEFICYYFRRFFF